MHFQNPLIYIFHYLQHPILSQTNPNHLVFYQAMVYNKRVLHLD
nr:MAG TPA: hypothetical protein [Bacteriophage sp.]